MAIRPWRTLSSEVALQAKRFAVRCDRAALPGSTGQVVDYDYLDERSGAIVVALDDKCRTILVEQYRYPIRATSLEFPSGCMNDGESPEEAARRELAEEVGIDAGPLVDLGPGRYADAEVDLLARCYRVVHDGPVRFADGEVVEARWVDRAGLDALLAAATFVPDSLALLPATERFPFPDPDDPQRG